MEKSSEEKINEAIENGDWLKFKELILFRLNELNQSRKESEEKTENNLKSANDMILDIVSIITTLKVKVELLWKSMGVLIALLLAAMVSLIFNFKIGG